MARRLRQLSAYLIGGLFLGPVFALIPACFVDQGSDGRIRVSFFSIAVTVLDPFVWTCAWNSLVVAVLATCLSAGFGVWIGRVIVKQGFATAGMTLFLATAGLAIPPMYAALGLLDVIRALAPSTLLGLNVRWIPLVLSKASNGVPFVAMITILSLRRIDPFWEDSARLYGATPRKIWRKIVWPVARPDLARALTLVFGASLLEPGSPTVLGLRRTIGFQMVQAAREGASMGRGAMIAVIGVGLAALAKLLLGWWGGARSARTGGGLPRRPRPIRPSWSGVLAMVSVLAIVLLVSGLPLIGIARGLRRGISRDSGGGVLPWITVFEEPWIRAALLNSVGLGITVVLVDLAVVKLLTVGSTESQGRERLMNLTRRTETIPPVIFGMGLFLTSELLRMAFGVSSDRSGTTHFSGSTIQGLLSLIDPRSGSWIPLILSVAALRFSLIGRSRVESSWELRLACLDSIRLGGGPAGRRPTEGWGAVSLASILLTFSLSANVVAPAVLLAPTAETRPIGPAIMRLSDSPQPAQGAAFALAVVGIGFNLVAFLGIARELKARPSEPL